MNKMIVLLGSLLLLYGESECTRTPPGVVTGTPVCYGETPRGNAERQIEKIMEPGTANPERKIAMVLNACPIEEITEASIKQIPIHILAQSLAMCGDKEKIKQSIQLTGYPVTMIWICMAYKGTETHVSSAILQATLDLLPENDIEEFLGRFKSTWSVVEAPNNVDWHGKNINAYRGAKQVQRAEKIRKKISEPNFDNQYSIVRIPTGTSGLDEGEGEDSGGGAGARDGARAGAVASEEERRGRSSTDGGELEGNETSSDSSVDSDQTGRSEHS
ncbi:hypothetical protein FACS1894126_3740 [Alphaproteobacteria bacterium]|nr:hypothetical protein FACS1894126_3740 [Alphaproteobacteria bacterium]